MSLEVVQPPRLRRQHGHDRVNEPRVITGEQFRRMLGWGKDRFIASARAGRFVSLISVNASSPRRTAYVLAKVEAWLNESPSLGRPSRQQRVAR